MLVKAEPGETYRIITKSDLIGAWRRHQKRPDRRLGAVIKNDLIGAWRRHQKRPDRRSGAVIKNGPPDSIGVVNDKKHRYSSEVCNERRR